MNGAAAIHSADIFRIPAVCQTVLNARDTAMNKIPAFLKLIVGETDHKQVN